MADRPIHELEINRMQPTRPANMCSLAHQTGHAERLQSDTQKRCTALVLGLKLIYLSSIWPEKQHPLSHLISFFCGLLSFLSDFAVSSFPTSPVFAPPHHFRAFARNDARN